MRKQKALKKRKQATKPTVLKTYTGFSIKPKTKTTVKRIIKSKPKVKAKPKSKPKKRTVIGSGGLKVGSKLIPPTSAVTKASDRQQVSSEIGRGSAAVIKASGNQPSDITAASGDVVKPKKYTASVNLAPSTHRRLAKLKRPRGYVTDKGTTRATDETYDDVINRALDELD